MENEGKKKNKWSWAKKNDETQRVGAFPNQSIHHWEVHALISILTQRGGKPKLPVFQPQDAGRLEAGGLGRWSSTSSQAEEVFHTLRTRYKPKRERVCIQSRSKGTRAVLVLSISLGSPASHRPAVVLRFGSTTNLVV